MEVSPNAELEFLSNVLRELTREISEATGATFSSSLEYEHGEYAVVVHHADEVAGFGLARRGIAATEAELADRLQDAVIDLCRVAWPPCPRPHHDHPLRARETTSEANWACPVDGQRIRPVASMPPPAG
jgi:hypothetical protein